MLITTFATHRDRKFGRIPSDEQIAELTPRHLICCRCRATLLSKLRKEERCVLQDLGRGASALARDIQLECLRVLRPSNAVILLWQSRLVLRWTQELSRALVSFSHTSSRRARCYPAPSYSTPILSPSDSSRFRIFCVVSGSSCFHTKASDSPQSAPFFGLSPVATDRLQQKTFIRMS